MIHCGSRGLGHQICSDHVRVMLDAMARYHISVPDAQLACAPVGSPEGRAYLAAMAAAANYGRANRQALTVAVRRAFEAATGTGDLALLYDVSHNLAKLEHHDVGGEPRLLCVHRKGATLALPPGHPGLPADLRAVGQPVLVPGSMGTASHVMVGVEPGGAFYSTCHGAGRTLSRHAAARHVRGEDVRRQLEADGIAVRATSARGLARRGPHGVQGRRRGRRQLRTGGAGPPCRRACDRLGSSKVRPEPELRQQIVALGLSAKNCQRPTMVGAQRGGARCVF